MVKIKRLSEVLDLMIKDLHEYEDKYNGEFAENPHVSLGNSKTRCVNEATLPIKIENGVRRVQGWETLAVRKGWILSLHKV